MYRYAVVFLLALVFSSGAFAGGARISFSESSAELGISTGGDYTDIVDFGITGYYNEDNDVLISLDMLTALSGDSSSPWLFSLGAKAFALVLKIQETKQLEEENETYFGAAVSFRTGYQFLTAIPLAAVMDIGYSPDILNNGDIQNIRQFGAFLEVLLSPSAIAQVGYRKYTASFDSETSHLGENDKDFEDNVVLGIKLQF